MSDIKEYPADFMMRNNQYAPMYCDIALEAYYEARKIYNTMTAAKWLMADPAVDYRMPEKVHKKVATTIVFSALAAEAKEYLLNNFYVVFSLIYGIIKMYVVVY